METTPPTQEEIDMLRRNSIVINEEEVLDTIDLHFLEALKRLKTRSGYDQTIMGNFITELEIELQKDIKKLTEFRK